MTIRRPALAALVIAAWAAPLAAQTTASDARHSSWFVYSGDHPVANRVGLVFDSHARLTFDDDHRRQLLLRPGVSFAVSERVKLSTGYTAVIARTDANDPLTPRRPEQRAWVSAQLAHALGRVSLGHRLRAEHRWLPGIRVDDAGEPIGETFVTAERLRYNIRATVPLSARGSARGFTASVSEELFASFGGYAGNMAVDQNRAAVSVGARLSRALRMELGYMLQSSTDDDGRFTERNHVLQITAISTARLR